MRENVREMHECVSVYVCVVCVQTNVCVIVNASESDPISDRIIDYSLFTHTLTSPNNILRGVSDLHFASYAKRRRHAMGVHGRSIGCECG